MSKFSKSEVDRDQNSVTSHEEADQDQVITRTDPNVDPYQRGAQTGTDRHATWNPDTNAWDEQYGVALTGQTVVDDTARQASGDSLQVLADGRIDKSSLPRGISVSNIGTYDAPEYLVTHDGINDDGTVSAGWAARCATTDDISHVINHRGRIPEDQDPAPALK